MDSKAALSNSDFHWYHLTIVFVFTTLKHSIALLKTSVRLEKIFNTVVD